MYEIMTLRVPFMGEDSRDLYRKILTGKTDPLPAEHPYSDELVAMLNWSLTVNNHKRPSAKEMLDSKIFKNMRKIIFNDTEYLPAKADEGLKIPVFIPLDKSKLKKRMKINFEGADPSHFPYAFLPINHLALKMKPKTIDHPFQ
jgi:serine/threonine protein kinase